jgi:methylmalonyl-CoA mutase, N-terminal domain
VQDALAGSYYVETLTSRNVQKIEELIAQIDAMGGAIAAVESGWMKGEVVRAAEEFQRREETVGLVRVGVNKYTEADAIEVAVPRTSPYKLERREDAEARQLASLQRVKRDRDGARVQDCLTRIGNAARDEGAKLIPLFVAAVKEYATAGEICGVLRGVFGEAR